MVMMPDGALWECTEVLLVSEKYKVFVVTGQPEAPGGRRAFFAVRPFNTLDAEGIEALRAKAGPVDDNDRVTFSPKNGQLEIYHRSTRTSSFFPINQLDPDVQQGLATQADDVWKKLLPPAKAPVATGAPLTVRKPLQLKNTP